MAKNIEVDAPVATEIPVAAEPAARPRTGLLVGGIVGGMLVGGLLFGGGLAVGLSLPGGHGGPGMPQSQAEERGQLPGGPGQLPQFGGGQQGPNVQGPPQHQQGGDRQAPPPAPPTDGDANNG
jgi:hypothetical protein